MTKEQLRERLADVNRTAEIYEAFHNRGLDPDWTLATAPTALGQKLARERGDILAALVDDEDDGEPTPAARTRPRDGAIEHSEPFRPAIACTRSTIDRPPPAPARPVETLGSMFGASAVDTWVEAANHAEQQLLDCRRLEEGLQSAAQRRVIGSFVQSVALANRLPRNQLAELRARMESIAAGKKN